MPRPVKATDKAIARAAERLRAGHLVAFPTETVYGLGADTFNPTAIRRVFELKQRPDANPLIAHVLDQDQARRVVASWDDRCVRLARLFWPGPLTLVLPRGEDVPRQATAGWPTIAVRCPAHPVAQRLLEAFGAPISAPSANRSGRVSPTRARHVADDFEDATDLLILDGGPCEVGIESTVLDLSGESPSVLRPGAVSVQALRGKLGEVAVVELAGQAASPGTTTAHYAPRTPTELVSGDELSERVESMSEPAVVLCIGEARVAAPHQAITMPSDADAYAARLYDALREADALGAARILIERPSGREGLWLAIADRLRRAAGSG